MIEAGLILFVSIIAVMCKMPKTTLQRILGYDYYVDIIVSVAMAMAMYGTYSGMMTAAVSALALSIAMYIAKRIVGFQRYSRKHGWELYLPKWRVAKAQEERI